MKYRLFEKNNKMSEVYLFGYHPLKDWVLIGSGIDNDSRWVKFNWFLENFTEIK